MQEVSKLAIIPASVSLHVASLRGDCQRHKHIVGTAGD